MTNEERKNYYMNRNIKLYPFYLALVWDVLFVWTISTLFYTTVKGLTFSQAIMIDSVQTIAACILSVPLTKIFAKVNSVTATRISSLGYIGFLLCLIFGKTFFSFAIGAIFLAFAYSLASVKVPAVLNKSLRLIQRDKDYERVYGKGLSIYYCLEAIAAIVATYLFDLNPYLPIYLSLGFVCLSELFSFLIKNPEKFQESNIIITPEHIEQQKIKTEKSDSFLKILSSSFVLVLLLYDFVFRGALCVDSTEFRLYLQQLVDNGSMPIWLFGYLFAIMRICMGLSSRYQFKFNLKFGLRSLIIFVGTFILTLISTSLIYLFMPQSIFKMVLLIVIMIITCMLRQPNSIFLSNYMQICTPSKNHEKLYALRTIFEYLGIAIINMLYAQLLSVFNNNLGYANLVYLSILALPIIALLVLFIRVLIKKYTQKYTIIKPEYTEDE